MIFELTQDFRDALAAVPGEHPTHRMLELLEEAIRRDIHFIDRHPTTLFQCMWNGLKARGDESFDEVRAILFSWHNDKCQEISGFRWLRLEMTTQTSAGKQRIIAFGGNPVDATISRNGRTIVLCSEREVLCLSLESGKRLTIHAEGGSRFSAVALTEDGSTLCLASCSAVKASRCEVVDTADGHRCAEFQIAGVEVLSVASSKKGDLLAVCGAGDKSGWGGVCDLGRNRLMWSEQLPGRLLRKVVFSHDDESIIAAGGDGICIVRTARSGRRIRDTRCHRRGVSDVSVSPSGEHVLTVGKDGTCAIWAIRGRKLRFRLKFAFESSPDAPLLAGSFINDNTVVLADYEGNVYQRSLAKLSTSIKLLGCGRGRVRLASARGGEILMVAANGNQQCYVLDLAAAVAAGSVNFASALSADYTQTGRRVALTLSTGETRSFDVDSRENEPIGVAPASLNAPAMASCVSSSRFHLVVAHNGQWQVRDTVDGTETRGSFSMRLERGAVFSISSNGDVVCAFSRERLEFVSIDSGNCKTFSLPMIACAIRLLDDGRALLIGHGCRFNGMWPRCVMAVWFNPYAPDQHKFAGPFGAELNEEDLAVLPGKGNMYLDVRTSHNGHCLVSQWNLMTLQQTAERAFTVPVTLLCYRSDCNQAVLYIPSLSECRIVDTTASCLNDFLLLPLVSGLDASSIRQDGEIMTTCDQAGTVSLHSMLGKVTT